MRICDWSSDVCSSDLRHRHQEFIRFLKRIEREVPKDKAIHVILGTYAAHKKDEVQQWLARHPRWTFPFTPTSSSWLHAVEGFFARSEEHTSELQSLMRISYAVFCLKKNIT